MSSKQTIATMVEKSRMAQEEYEKYNQNQVDTLVREIAKVIYDNAELLAEMAVEETKMGVYEDKVKKNQGKAKIIWNSLKGRKSVGIINNDSETGIVEIAKPKGVIAAVTPCTNPVVTPMCNAMFAIKGRNSIIIAPHPRSKRCSSHTVRLMNNVLNRLGAPENLIQVIEEPEIELTNELMKSCDVVVATGGMGMVKAAYSSGKPAFGVGQGNVQCIIDRGTDIRDTVQKIIAGRIFDNGIICSGEQTVIIADDEYAQVIEEFQKNGALYIEEPGEKERLRKALFPDGVMNKDLVGQSVHKVAEAAKIKLPEQARLILVKADGMGTQDILCKEKMCPVIAVFTYTSFQEAVEIAQSNLELEGKGHSVSIHSHNEDNIKYAGEKLTISRLSVNQPAATTLGGSFHNGFSPTTTLGCGSWGNNSISENLNYTHLLNITRIGFFMENAKVPTDEELWG